MPAISLALGLLLSAAAVALSVIALVAARARSPEARVEKRLAALEEQVRGLLFRVGTLERTRVPTPDESGRTPAALERVAAPAAAAPLGEPVVAPPTHEPERPAASPAPAPTSARGGLDLEQRIGARWATWIGIVVILVAVALFLKWAFDNAYLGAGARVAVGIVVGLLMLGGGGTLSRRRDVPYLSEGLAGGGLGVLYLSLYAAHAVYDLLGASSAFAGMFAVTLLGALVAVMTSRLSVAMLPVLGGLLTPVLLQVDRPDERNLLAYLLVLDTLALLVARFRTWPTLNRLAWVGTAILVLGPLLGGQGGAQPVTRLVLLSALFLIFLAAPLFKERAIGSWVEPLDLALIVANAGGYFWAVYITLEAWRPGLEAPWALALALLYRLASADYASRVPEDESTVIAHEGVSWTFLTLAIALGLGGQWITLAWGIEGAMLLWLAARAPSAVGAWGGLGALLLAAVRAIALDAYWAPAAVQVWNVAFLIHLVVVGALVAGGLLAGRMHASPGTGGSIPERLQACLWVVAAGTLAVLLWREPPGLWPAVLLTAELVLVALLGQASRSPTFMVAVPMLSAIVAVRVLIADDDLARVTAAGSLVSLPLLSRVAATIAIGLAGGRLARSPRPDARPVGQVLSGAAGLMLLVVLSLNWTRYQQQPLVEGSGRGRARPGTMTEGRWRTQVGLSVLWALYAAAALAWGFARRNAALRYAALGLLGFTVLKVFAVDLAEVKTAYRIVSFLVLGLVLLLVGVAYQRILAKPSKGR
ncbi:MAG TPA: DUF2339 domain-containing protein [Candidatus Methylomirabilis sp.]|nr:DUF2339 domain-containing protein [Candidatus Methylomirabilis sp.]